MNFRNWRLKVVVCSLLLLLAFPECTIAQDVPAGFPPEWFNPIGGAPASPTGDPNAAIGTSPTVAVPSPSPEPIPAVVTPDPVPSPSPEPAPVVEPTPTTPEPTPVASPAPVVDPATVPASPAPVEPTPTPVVDPATITTPSPSPTTPEPTPVVDPATVASPAPTTPITASPAPVTVSPAVTTTPVAVAPTTDPTAGFLSPAPVASPPADPNAGSLVGAGTPAEAPSGDGSNTNGDGSGGDGPSPSPIADDLPPAPPMDWKALPVDTEIIFGLQLDGPYLAPWTKSKSWVFTNVLADRYLRSVDVSDIETGPLETKQYNVPNADSEGARRRLLTTKNGNGGGGGARRLLGTNDPGSTIASSVLLRVKVHTNYIRVESEVRSVVDGVSSGTLAEDLSMALGAPVTNVTLTAQPITQPYDFLEDPNASTGGSLPGWIIGCIVGAVLVLLPIPAYILYKRHKKKHLEAVERQQAEAAAARQRMQTRIIKASGKSFTGREGEENFYGGPGAPGSVTSFGPYSPSGPGSVMDGRSDSMSMRQNSFMTPRSSGRMPTPQQQLYQQQSLGPGAMPAAATRAPSYVNMSFNRGSVLPIRGSDEASTSSGNLSERR